MFSKKLGKLLHDARKQSNISREELARRANVSTRLVAELERGQRPNVSLESTLRLLNLVGVSIAATAPDGGTAEIRGAGGAARERAARAELRRRTWTGRHIYLREEGEAPAGGRSIMQRLSAVSQISRQAFALSTKGNSQNAHKEHGSPVSKRAAKPRQSAERGFSVPGRRGPG